MELPPGASCNLEISAGKPKASDEMTICGYQVQGCVQKKNEAIEASKKTLGRFILATNDLDSQRLQDKDMLPYYKTQGGVERGYAFIKDKTFEVDAIFLKKPSRIAALLAIMTLALLIYGACQLTIRQGLKKDQKIFLGPNKRRIANPTAKMVFRNFRMVQVLKRRVENRMIETVINLKEDLKDIVGYFGDFALQIYGLELKKNS